jgi:hypothetical protein
MAEFVNNIIGIAAEFAHSHPQFVDTVDQLFCPVSETRLREEIIDAAATDRNEKLRLFTEKRFVTLALDAATISHIHFVNFVVNHVGLVPILYRSIVRDTVNSEEYEISAALLYENSGISILLLLESSRTICGVSNWALRLC